MREPKPTAEHRRCPAGSIRPKQRSPQTSRSATSEKQSRKVLVPARRCEPAAACRTGAPIECSSRSYARAAPARRNGCASTACRDAASTVAGKYVKFTDADHGLTGSLPVPATFRTHRVYTLLLTIFSGLAGRIPKAAGCKSRPGFFVKNPDALWTVGGRRATVCGAGVRSQGGER